MTDIEDKIKRLEKEKKIADEKFAKELERIRQESNDNESLLQKSLRCLTSAQIRNIKQAQKLGFKPKEISHRLNLDYDMVEKICHNESSRLAWRKKNGKPNTDHPYANGKRPDYIIGTDLWRRRIRRGHQGEITNTLSDEGQRIHDERKECPFCFEDSKKYGQSMDECVRYLKDRQTENGKIWKIDNDNKPFPTTKPKYKQQVQEDTSLPEDIMVKVNDRPLTDEEFEVLDAPDEEIQQRADDLLESEPKEPSIVDKAKALFGSKPDINYPDESTRRYMYKLERTINANKTELDNLKRKYSQDKGKGND